MRVAGTIRRRIGDDRGSVLVFLLVGLPILLAVFAIALDVGNWFVHHRSLQNQVDAAALAGGDSYIYCFNGVGSSQMEADAGSYASVYNKQYGGPHGGTEGFAYNSNTYPSGAAGSDSVPSDPCTPPYVFDVKGSEQNLPLMLGGLLPGSTPLSHIDAHARVELRQATIFSGFLPLGVPDPSPNFAFATFIDESTGGPIAGCASSCTVQLSQSGTSGGNQLWSSLSAPLNVPAVASVGVRIRLVGGTDSTAACGQALVSCYDANSTNGLVYIRGWNGGAAAPSVHNAWLLRGSCSPDAYFTSAPCGAGLQAEVDLGAAHPLTGAFGQSATVTASAGGTNAVMTSQANMSPGGCNPSSSTCNVWSTLSGLPLAAAGRTTVNVASWTWQQTSGTWQGNNCKSTGSNPCKDNGNFASPAVQRGFVANPTASGPIEQLQIGDAGLGTGSGANSFQIGSPHALTITLGTLGSLAVQSSANDPTVELRITGGSQNLSVDCDPNVSTLRAEIAGGCAPQYTINNGTACPSYNNLWGTPQPWNCVKAQTGGAVGQVAQGLSDRILDGGNTCTAPIHWPNWSVGDPRIVELFLVPFNSLNGNGNTIVPVVGAANFYITGWSGDPCPGATQVAANGDIAGHFIKYVSPNPGSTGTAPCSPTALAPCIPVMTR